ncbi:MAG: DUF305 domain-containing protein [Pseudonocardiales bacterium]
MRVRALTGMLATAAATLVLAGCGGNTTGTTSPGGPQPPSSVPQQVQDHNQADISFAQEMIPHHAQAIQMAQLAPDRAQSPQVKDLASRIEQAQGPEIETMTGWLRAWNAEVPPTGESGGAHGGGMGTGGMDHQQMQQLGQATGVEFDRLFLQMMIKHHEGAVETARTELENGQNPEAKQLAQQIIDTQQAEIEEMQALLPQG